MTTTSKQSPPNSVHGERSRIDSEEIGTFLNYATVPNAEVAVQRPSDHCRYQEPDAGVATKALCRKHRNSVNRLYKWKSKRRPNLIRQEDP